MSNSISPPASISFDNSISAVPEPASNGSVTAAASDDNLSPFADSTSSKDTVISSLPSSSIDSTSNSISPPASISFDNSISAVPEPASNGSVTAAASDDNLSPFADSTSSKDTVISSSPSPSIDSTSNSI